MKKQAREKFNALLQKIAQDNGVDSVAEKFNLDVPVEHRMVEQMTEKSDFLKEINIVGVDEAKAQKLGLGVGNPIASRTDTDNEERKTAYAGSLAPDKYECQKTDFDTHLPYRVLDTWSASTKFETLYRAAVLKRVGLDKIMIGWNGTSAAATTNRAENKMLQDVNIGWLEKVRSHAPSRLMGYDSEGLATESTFRIGEGGEYGTLDAIAFDVMSNLLDAWHHGSDDLVLILGRELWVHHGLTLYNDNKAATERNALQTWFANELVAGLKTVTVPFFPARGLVVTSYDNLSLYFQSGAVRRAIIDNPKRDRIEEYLSSNDAYVVEDYGKFGGVRDGAIKLKNAAGEWV